MSRLREGLDCPFSGHGEDLVNVKFFRGTRDDLITAAEIFEQSSLVSTQVKAKAADVSRVAPMSKHEKINVRELGTSINRVI